MDEQLFITGCRRGESWARKKLYEMYAPAMMSLCLRYVGDKETARDLLQDGFIKVFTKMNTYSGTGAFGGWIYRIFMTTALEHLRKTEKMNVFTSIDEYPDKLEDTEISALDSLSADDLLSCVAELPVGYRTVFNLHAIEGYSHREIGEMLGISEITSRSQFIRSRSALQKKLELLIKEENVRQQRAKSSS
ncbi:RNA polymerase sigma factor [Bacteroides sp. 519]|uniref:RNA polymerase sigma factor n=1 Tax=Bacteroides sp. 519 TaxID=2302937 RepID=UPI0013D76C38|nr:sigma-70 family RNA polymerase sigma factor [Bacteroides sp. 519]NDV57439.1 sigma-70 family RNA polymerase sigma factor [Bacteroides sp. 519]